MICPEDHIRVDNLTVSLAWRSSSLEARGLEVVVSEHLDPPLDGQVVQLVGDLQLEQVIDGEKVQHPAINPRL